MINTLALETRKLLKNILTISYHSKGAWSYETMMRMSPLERDLAVEIINEEIEKAKPKGRFG